MSDIIKAVTDNINKGWPWDAHKGWTPQRVQEYCVFNPKWQAHRLSMKGKLTRVKLVMLRQWRMAHELSDGSISDIEQCQIDNYLGALRRGGQLDHNNMIRKEI